MRRRDPENMNIGIAKIPIPYADDDPEQSAPTNVRTERDLTASQILEILQRHDLHAPHNFGDK